MRERISDRVESLARIYFPIIVETHNVHRTALGGRDNSARVIYVDLNECDETYADEGQFDDFNISCILIVTSPFPHNYITSQKYDQYFNFKVICHNV